MGFSLAQKALFNKTAPNCARYELGTKLMNELKQIAVYEHDFAVDGGAIGAITLRSLNTDGAKIPDNAIIQNAYVEVLTTYTTASADAGTIALSVESANDIVSAIAVSNGANPWDAGFHQGVPDMAAVGDWVKTDSEVDVTLTVATQAVTAGKMRVYLEYVLSV